MGGNFLAEFFLNFFLEKFFGGTFLEDFLGRIFRRIFLGGFFWEEFFGRNYLVEINKELMFLSRFWGYFVSRQEGRKEEENFNL